MKGAHSKIRHNWLPALLSDVMIFLCCDCYDKKRVWYEETEIKLTPKEWKILELLSENKGRIVTKELLLEKIWDAEGNFAEEHVVSVSVNRLRKKIEKNVDKPVFIRNIFGLGYTFGD